MMDLCEGYFSPNASTPGASYNVTSCTNKTTLCTFFTSHSPHLPNQSTNNTKTDHFDPADTINNELKLGNLHVNLTALQWPQALTDGIQALNISLDATFILYCIGIACSGLVIILSAIAFFLPSAYHPTYASATNHHYHSRFLSVFAGILAILAFLALGVASAIVTVFMVKVVDLVGQYGNDIGLYAYKGDKFLAITWAATVVMLLAVVAWFGECCFRRRVRRREWAEKPVSNRGMGWRGWM
jgi:hypothetical protein